MRHARGGFSLMEVMLATSIVLGSSIVLVELASIGRRQASTAYNLNIAQLLCQAKLDEIVAGVSTIKTGEEQELEDQPGWLYTVETMPMRRQHLVAIKVTVLQEPQEYKKSVQFTLIRWLPDDSLDSTSTTSADGPSAPVQRGPLTEDQP